MLGFLAAGVQLRPLGRAVYGARVQPAGDHAAVTVSADTSDRRRLQGREASTLGAAAASD